MNEPSARRSAVSKVIPAHPKVLYRAFLNPDDLIAWLPPGDMTGDIYSFDAREGGGYEMSLFYPMSETGHPGKTAEREDRLTSRFVRLVPSEKIVQSVLFHSSDPNLTQEMRVEVTFEPRAGGTEVTIVCEDIPPGIRLEDNETGSRLSLENLARYVVELQR